MSEITHEKLWSVCKKLPGDYEPYGQTERNSGDCSCGCPFYAKLEGKVSSDWGVCTNPESHRAGLLTFEHQGCNIFEEEDET